MYVAQIEIPQTAAPMERWRVYKNEEYRFKIKYPSNWVVIQSSKKLYNDNEIFVISYNNPGEEWPVAWISISIMTLSKDDNRDFWLYDKISTTHQKRIIFKGKKALEESIETPSDFHKKFGVLLNNNTILYIRLLSLLEFPKYREHELVFKTMIENLKLF
jgi:hypothetical protein